MTVTVMGFGYLILMSIDFMISLLHFLLSFTCNLDQGDQRQCDIFSNTSKSINNMLRCIIFSTLSVFGNKVKHGLSCLIYHLTYV